MTITEVEQLNLPVHSPPGIALHGAFDSLGDFVQAVYYRKRDPRIDNVFHVQNAMSERVPADGGYLVPEEYREELVSASLEFAIMRPKAHVFPMRSYRLGIPTTDETTHVGSLFGGWSLTWAEEASPLTDTTAGFQRNVMEANKLAGTTTVPNELFDDTRALEAFIRQTLPEGIAWYEDDAFINGSGQAEPRGAITAPCAVFVTRSASSKVLQVDIQGMVQRLWARGWKNALWLCGTDVLAQLVELFQVFGTGPTNTGLPNNPWLVYDAEMGCWKLAGIPCCVTEHTAALGTVGDLALIDPTAYHIGDREVMTIQTSPHVKFANDLTVVRVRHRVDGGMWPNSPVTPLNSTNTVSPVVVLQ